MSASLPAQALIDVEIRDVLSVSIVTGFRVDQGPQWATAHGHLRFWGD